MNISNDTIEKMLKLSALDVSEEQKGTLVSQLSKILEHMEALDQVDVSAVSPMYFGCDDASSTRADEVSAFDDAVIKKESRFVKNNMYSVPNIIEDEE